MKHVRRINPSLYNNREVTLGNPDLPTSDGTDFLRDELNLARKLDAFNTGTDILTFTLGNADVEPAVIDAEAHTVTLEVVNGTGLTGLEPTVTLSVGASVSPETAQDFDGGAVTYTVTAGDGTEQEWAVTITEAGA